MNNLGEEEWAIIDGIIDEYGISISTSFSVVKYMNSGNINTAKLKYKDCVVHIIDGKIVDINRGILPYDIDQYGSMMEIIKDPQKLLDKWSISRLNIYYIEYINEKYIYIYIFLYINIIKVKSGRYK